MKRPDTVALPPYAYVPGMNARHDPDFFAPFHASVSSCMGPDELQNTLAWRAGRVFVHSGYFWEAHEVLEPVWMALPTGSGERFFVQAIIQAANAALKLKMQRPKATIRLCGIAAELLIPVQGVEAVMGWSVKDLETFLTAVRNQGESIV